METESQSTSPPHSPPESTPSPADSSSSSLPDPTACALSRYTDPIPDRRRLAIPLGLIDHDHLTQHRLSETDDDISHLAAELRSIGQTHPITVTTDGPRFRLIAGYRRVRAALTAGWTHIDATIDDRDEATLKVVRASENFSRRNLTPLENAMALSDLVEYNAQGVDAVAAQIGRSTDWILRHLEILSYPDDLKRILHQGKISQSAARVLAKISDPGHMADAIRIAEVSGINARTARDFLGQYDAQKSAETPPPAINAPPSPQAEQMQTYVDCHACATPTPYQDTTTIRLCALCRQNIDKAISQPPPPPEP